MLVTCWLHVGYMLISCHPDSSKLLNKLFKKSSFLCVFFAISEQVRKLLLGQLLLKRGPEMSTKMHGFSVSFLNAGTVLQQSYLVNGSKWVRFPSENSTIRDHVFGWFFFPHFRRIVEKTHTDEKKWVHFRRPKWAHHPFLLIALWTLVFFASENE